MIIRSYILPILLIGAILSEINLTLIEGDCPVRISAGDMVILTAVFGYMACSWKGLKEIVCENITPVAIGLAFILISLTTSCINNEYLLVSIKFCVKICILFFLLVLIYQHSYVSRGTLTLVLAIMMVINIIGILEYFYYDRMLNFLLFFRSQESLAPYQLMRVSSVFPNTNTFSVFNAIFIVSTLSIILQHGRLVNRYLFSITLLLCIVGLIFSTSRNGILTIVTGTALLAVSLVRSRKSKWKVCAITACTLAILVAAFSAYKPIPLAKRFSNLVSLAPEVVSGQPFEIKEMIATLRLEQRLTIWQNGWELFLEKPVFGIGASQFITRNNHPGGRTIHMHNIFGDILVNHGIVGFALFIALVTIWFKKAKSDWQVFLIITLFVSHMFDCFTLYNTIWLIFTPWLVALTTRKPEEILLQDVAAQPDKRAVTVK